MATESGINVTVQLYTGATIRLNNAYIRGNNVAGTTATGKETIIRNEDIKVCTQI